MSIALEQFKAEAFSLGLTEGRTKGGLAGRTAMLMKILSRRFGEVPPSVQACIEAATIEELDTWFEAAIDAPTLDSVFTSPRR